VFLHLQEPGPPWIPPGQLRLAGPLPLPEQHVRAGRARLHYGAKWSRPGGGQQSLLTAGHVRCGQHSHFILRGV